MGQDLHPLILVFFNNKTFWKCYYSTSFSNFVCSSDTSYGMAVDILAFIIVQKRPGFEAAVYSEQNFSGWFHRVVWLDSSGRFGIDDFNRITTISAHLFTRTCGADTPPGTFLFQFCSKKVWLASGRRLKKWCSTPHTVPVAMVLFLLARLAIPAACINLPTLTVAYPTVMSSSQY